MDRHAARIQGPVGGLTAEQARCKQGPASWSVLEVVIHLQDEEREGFRVRIDHTLHCPGEPWPGSRPAGQVAQQHYNERDLAESPDGFLPCREGSSRATERQPARRRGDRASPASCSLSGWHTTRCTSANSTS